jgi:hypothetical protein
MHLQYFVGLSFVVSDNVQVMIHCPKGLLLITQQFDTVNHASDSKHLAPLHEKTIYKLSACLRVFNRHKAGTGRTRAASQGKQQRL